MRKVIRVIADKLDVETAITLDPNGEVTEINEGCLPTGAIDQIEDMLAGLDLRTASSITVLLDGDESESHIVWDLTRQEKSAMKFAGVLNE